MTRQMLHRSLWLALPVSLGLVVQIAFAFYPVVLAEHTPLLQWATALLESPPFLKLTLLGLLPFAALSAVCFAASFRLSPGRLAWVGFGGLLGILCLMLPGEATVWTSQSSTAILGLVTLPFQCLWSLLAGLVLGMTLSFLSAVRPNAIDNDNKSGGEEEEERC